MTGRNKKSKASEKRVLDSIKKQLHESAELIAPWFMANMPEYYFRTHGEAELLRHLHAVISGQVITERQTVSLWNPDRTRVTYISPGGTGKALQGHLAAHGASNIKTARIYASTDGSLRLDTFLLAPQSPADPHSKAFKAAFGKMVKAGLDAEDQETFSDFLRGATGDYVDKFDPIRAARHFRLSRSVRRLDAVHVEINPQFDRNESRIIVCLSEPPSHGLILQVVQALLREKLTIRRGYADHFELVNGPDLAILSFYVSRDGKALPEESQSWERLEHALSKVKWLAPHGLQVLTDEAGWSLDKTSLLQAACEFAHQFLIKTNLYAYTSEHLVRALLSNRVEAAACLEYFLVRFDPNEEDRLDRSEGIYERTAALIDQVDDEVAAKTLTLILRFFKHTLRTNYFLPRRFGLSFRVDPAFLDEYYYVGDLASQERPFGFFFFHGPGAQGFHVRYRETARGGVRLVPTGAQEQFEVESNRLFDEASGLALSQQYKNKDIPEGGAKAVILLGPHGEPTLAYKSMVDSLLDITMSGPDGPTLPGVVDHLGREEIIYLGPDERITPDHIRWTVNRARERGYRWPNALMSSKPETGINHKRYGVTSLGVIVFALEALRALGVNPKTAPFSVKLTGGPAGDVAGNAVKQFIGEYGKNARIVAMSDGHGAAYDPEGLDHEELLRLVQKDVSIDAFNPDLLKGKGAFVVSAATSEGAKLRNSIHNTAKADLFIPAGGRPDSINLDNWDLFLDADGKPSSPAIVEGANLFISASARARLEASGVLIIPGPSANKTGVICSSYEILAGLVLSDEEFLAIKQRYVAETLAILKEKAALEARLMFREYKAHGGKKPLTEISYELSREINAFSDRLYEMLMRDDPDPAATPELAEVVAGHCPPVLVEKYVERVLTETPRRYLYAIIAAHMAAKIVYAEGVGWLKRVADLRDIRRVMDSYLNQEKKLKELSESLSRSRIRNKEEIVRIINAAGTKLLADEDLGLL